VTGAATDPRRVPGTDGADIRPVVASPSAGMPVWIMVTGLAVLALVLFFSLDARRRSASAPAVRMRDDSTVTPPQALTPLVVPPEPVLVAAPPPEPVPTPRPAPRFQPPPPQPRIVYMPQTTPPVAPPAPPAREATESAITLDLGPDTAAGGASARDSAAPPSITIGDGTGIPGSSASPARATLMRNRPTTVVQGTLIPAVMEAAFDSTRPGPTRAVVSRDVRGFDGARVLIPRGSRLFGEYRAQLQPGQNRALITWTRLIRPDGVTIAIGSPAADTLGRAGVRGKVNTHFLEKFGLAVLQTSLDVGANIASRSIGNNNGSVIVALPAVGQTLTQPLGSGQQIPPTLRIPQGTSISVFVARDLDFTPVENRR
jgi:type IV secretion system protein VirB10